MEKRIFEEQHLDTEPQHQAKREFDDRSVIIDAVADNNTDEPLIEPVFKPSRFWIRLLLAGLILFGIAVLAQSVQWLLDTWQANQWIAFVFTLAFLGVSLAGIGALINEWRKLVWLRKHHHAQQQSRQLLSDPQTSGEQAKLFCQQSLARMRGYAYVQQAEQRWLSELNEAYNAKEVMYLFSQNVLAPVDTKIKQLISKNAVENAVIVALSPLAMIDVLMMAWRNIALVNKITRAYGMELGYISRLKLFRLVLTNMVFAGATEIATDLGSEFFAQNLTAKLSMRAAQGIGVGLLTARLGIKAMEFCRPVVFSADERPTLSLVRQELLGALKTQLFSTSKASENKRV